MKHNKQKISKIVDELMTFCFSVGANDINVNVKEDENYYKIYLSTNYLPSCSDRVKELCKLLECSKREEMEEYYWYLAGESDVDTELSLVGMMVDKCSIQFPTDNHLEITLYRHK